MIGCGVMDDKVRRFCGVDAYRPYGMAEMALTIEWIGKAL